MSFVIRQVSVLKGRAKKEAEKMDLDKNDLVIVKTRDFDPLPTYELEKIEGEPVKYLLERTEAREEEE